MHCGTPGVPRQRLQASQRIDASDGGVGDAEPEDVRVESGAAPCTAEDFVWAEISGFQSCNER